MSGAEGAGARVRGWRDDQHAAVCDVIQPWEHGAVVRATSRPDYWNFNVVRVEDDPGMGVAELIAFADDALAPLAHRRIDFDRVEAADRLRQEFEALGWKAERLVWMAHTEPLPPGEALPVEEVAFDDVRDLRVAWHREDYGDSHDPDSFLADSREISLARDARVIARIEDGEAIGFAQIERAGDAAEITHVYVGAAHRGRSLGTALTRAAVEVSGDVDDLWIVADDEDRPKHLYGRLGFRPVWTTMEFLRMPETG